MDERTEYRQRAEAILAVAIKATSHHARAALLSIAAKWHRLAGEAEQETKKSQEKCQALGTGNGKQRS